MHLLLGGILPVDLSPSQIKPNVAKIARQIFHDDAQVDGYDHELVDCIRFCGGRQRMPLE